ncbi:MAG: response regulator [Polymorphobacter sp.]|uniref:response regulator n=1 Tax=Polymorphobacter sp. TaxID=1909290 RepID=UPI003A8BE497
MAEGQPCRVVLADDHAIVRAGVRAALEETGRYIIVEEAATGLSALAEARVHQPDLILLDAAMPMGSGLEILEELRRWCPQTCIVVLTGLTSRGVLRFVQAAGADGLFLKSDPPDIWVPLLDMLGKGGFITSPAAAAALAEDVQTDGLSRREMQVLLAVARGEGNAAIAERLGISAKTVDKHRTSLMRKLGVHSVAELLAVALREGLLDTARHI